MKTFYGPFRTLEPAFLTHLSGLKSGPGRAGLVLCPSSRVGAHLRRQLVKQQGLISNLHFVTFSQLIATLDAEVSGIHKPLLPGDNLHDYSLKTLLVTPGLDRYRVSRGFVTALRASLRDLSDGLVVAEVLSEHLQATTDPMLEEESAHLQWLIKVFEKYQQKMEQIPGYRSYQTYFEQALTQIEKSAWLKQFAEIIVYGFYEFTGRQLEIFNTLREQYALTVFWPYAAMPAFIYGRKFFETNILGVSAQTQALSSSTREVAAGAALEALFTAETATQCPAGLHFVSAPDATRELSFVAKEILRLHEEEHIAYADMAITARSMEAYKTVLPDLFAQQGIPLQTDFTFSFVTKPLGIFLINLLSLARRGFDKEDVLAVVNSPYFKQRNSWRYLIAESLAKRDYAQWVDLVRPHLSHYDPAFLKWLKQTKKQLEELEAPQPWDKARTATLTWLQQNTNTDIFTAEERQIWQEVLAVLEGFGRYTAVSAQAREREFLEELFAALQTIELHQVVAMPSGVMAADVGALRGLNFKVVFLLALNEKSFPQVVREDPILKDYYRRILRDQLGFWINQKMERFDEERLLFFCAAEAAETHLYLSFLRADEEGKPLVPSGYLVELARAAHIGLEPARVHRVPWHWWNAKGDDFLRLTPKELSWTLAAVRAEQAMYQAAGLTDENTAAIFEAAEQISSSGALTDRDGKVTSGPQIFTTQNAKGFSPSALQDLAHCPMKYFLSKGLGLKELDDALSRSEMAANLRGIAYHEILMQYYQYLLEQGLVGQLFDSALQAQLDRAILAHYTPASYKTFGIYPVIWDLILTDIHDKLSAFVQKDAEQLGDYVPSIFETQFEKVYAPSKNLQLKFKGVIDRIDVDREHKTFRIMDYKSSRHGGKDLAADMFKHVILQPFIYLILAQDATCTQGLTADGAVLLNINKGYARQELTATRFDTVKERAAQFFILLSQLILKGQFFINPTEHCQYCPYTTICRKDSFHSLLRARHAVLASQLEEAKQ